MKRATLITRDGVFLITDRVERLETIPPETDVLIGPSLTFRKNFEIPRDIDQSPRKLKMKIFSRFLPDDIDTFTCQFITESSGSSRQKRVNGFGISNDKLKEIKSALDEPADIYFLETLLINPFPEHRTETKLSLPDGELLARFESNLLIWSHFRQRGEDSHVHIPAYLPEPNREYSSDPFPASSGEEGSTGWVEDFRNCVEEDPPVERSLGSRSLRPLWDQLKGLTYATVALLLVTLIGWIGVTKYANAVRRNWMQTHYERLIGKSTQRPYRQLKSTVENLRSTVPESPRKRTTDPLYAVIPAIDPLFSNTNVKLLTLSLSRNALEVTFLSPSLEEAEQFRNTLQSVETLKNPSIINSRTVTGDDYSYEIDLNSELILQ